MSPRQCPTAKCRLFLSQTILVVDQLLWNTFCAVETACDKAKQFLVLSSAAPINALTSRIKHKIIYINFLLNLGSVFLPDFITRPPIGLRQRIYRGFIVQKLYFISFLSAVKVCDHSSEPLSLTESC